MRHLLIRLLGSMGVKVILAAGAAAILPAAARAGITADAVVSYTPGTAPAAYQGPAAALGPIQGDTTFGGLNPFNPPFDPSQIVIVGEGGSLTLHLSAPVATNGVDLGVFVNNGIIDESADGSGLAGSPAATFSAFPKAVTSVSQDGVGWVALDSGASISFTNPTNYFLDSEITGYFQPLGTLAADQFKPFLGSIASFDGQTYDQMKTTLDGSAGGTWLDLSATGLGQVNYVRFDVPAGDGRMVVDSVAGVPATAPLPAAVWAGFMALAGMAALRAGRYARVNR
jgi:hypothetical protein